MPDDDRPDTGIDADPTDGRNETENQRFDRNWSEILQELRVTQTGTQILTGFLLTLAFQPRFEDLDQYQVDVYLGLVVLAALSTALGLAPVSLHRALFRKKAKREVVGLADRLLRVTILCVGLLITGVVLLIFDVVIGRGAGIGAAAVTAALLLLMWIALPVMNRPRPGSRQD